MRSAFAFVLCWCIGGTAAAETTRLPSYESLDRTAITVSGLSSGGFFAHQFHIAYSGLVNGAGIMAGGPYACAEQIPFSVLMYPVLYPKPRLTVALGICTYKGRLNFLPEGPDAGLSLESTRAEHGRGTIDNPANLADDRVWLFRGTLDSIVPAASLSALRAYYESLGVKGPDLAVDTSIPAAHGLPVESFEGASAFPKRGCREHEPPFVIDCDRDAAELLLRHLYAGSFQDTPKAPVRERLIAFDQKEFFNDSEPSVSLDEVGYVYVPAGCANGAGSRGSCRLHVAFHGCRQYRQLVDDDFSWDGGYNRWAEANNIIVLYPQTVSWPWVWDLFGGNGNPEGCWDFWGYSGLDYATRNGRQMRAVKAMVDRLLGQ